ncbi:hypothetical protein, partial [Vibrio sp. 03_296]|uniref:hypothetical protein n=1 Tax=Vibrio sp. 03_296 TaxID=2024409 RepID=UPI002D7ECFA7
ENHCYTGPDFDFRNPMVHSIVTSGHKWPGAPATGVYMTKHKFMVLHRITQPILVLPILLLRVPVAEYPL